MLVYYIIIISIILIFFIMFVYISNTYNYYIYNTILSIYFMFNSENPINYFNNDNINYYELNTHQFQEELIKNYEYTKNKDCKYWSYVWANYITNNNIEKGKVTYILISGHMFIIGNFETHYCIIDQVNINCYKY